MIYLNGEQQTNWYIVINGREFGPFPNKQLAEYNSTALINQLNLDESITAVEYISKTQTGSQVLLG